MIRDREYRFPVVVPVGKLDKNGGVTGKEIHYCLLKKLASMKASKFGYFLRVSKVMSIGKAEIDDSSKQAFFRVTFLCRTFEPEAGEVITGVVWRVVRSGVFLKHGPADSIYLSARKMPNYRYIPGRNPFFIGEDLSRIEKDVVIRFAVLAVKWKADAMDFRVLANMEGDGLGPVSRVDLDDVDLM